MEDSYHRLYLLQQELGSVQTGIKELAKDLRVETYDQSSLLLKELDVLKNREIDAIAGGHVWKGEGLRQRAYEGRALLKEALSILDVVQGHGVYGPLGEQLERLEDVIENTNIADDVIENANLDSAYWDNEGAGQP